MPQGSMTLIEYLKTVPKEDLVSAVVGIWSKTSVLWELMPFENIIGGSTSHYRRKSRPATGFRSVNQAYAPTFGEVEKITDPLVIAGGELEIDTFLIQTEGMGRRASEEAAQIEDLALRWIRAFIKGTNNSVNGDFLGLQSRTANLTLSAGNGAGGSALNLYTLNEAISKCRRPNAIIMNNTMHLRLEYALVKSGLYQNIITTWGESVPTYKRIPIIVLDDDEEGTEGPILGFDEAAASGDPTATSIYVVNFGPQGVTGIQAGPMRVKDFGEIQEKSAYLTRIEWFCGMAVRHPKAAVRIRNIANAAVTTT